MLRGTEYTVSFVWTETPPRIPSDLANGLVDPRATKTTFTFVKYLRVSHFPFVRVLED